MSNLSNYPPGHPTWSSSHEAGKVLYCDPCGSIWPESDGKKCFLCKKSKQVVQAECECGKPATYIFEDAAVNYFEARCGKCA